jgi:hypothetical protein
MCMAQQAQAPGETNTGGAALTGAASGAAMGTMLMPGWGTAIGAVAGAAMGVVGSITNNKNARKSEEARRIARDQQITENRRRATEDYLSTVRTEQNAQAQENAAWAEKSVDIARQRDITVGTAVASAAERGVAGRSVEQIVQDYHFQSDMESGRLRINQLGRNNQHWQNIQSMDRQYYNRITGTPTYAMQPVAPVDYFGPALSLAGNLAKTGMASGMFKNADGSNIGSQKIDWTNTPVNPEEYK